MLPHYKIALRLAGCAGLCLASSLLPAPFAPVASAATGSLIFESAWFDLDSGAVEDNCDQGSPCSGQQDFKFAYEARRPNPIVLVQDQGAGREIAFLDGRPFDSVGPDDIAGASWTSGIVDQPFDPDDTILVRTDLGQVFKVGEAQAASSVVRFCHELLRGCLSVAFESAWFDLDSGTVELDCDSSPCSGDEDFKFAYDASQPNPIALFHDESGGREVAFLDGIPFGTVGPTQVVGASWSSTLVSQPFDPDDTILVRTDLGHVYKVGGASTDGTHVRFCHGFLAGGAPTANPPRAGLALRQNVPNPFNPSTTIHFELPAAGRVQLVVYDSAGKRVRELARGEYPAGAHTMRWDGKDETGRPVATGVYHYEIRVAGERQARRMILLR